MKKSRVFGGKCLELLATLDQELLSWRTSQISLPWVEQQLLDRLPQSGTVQNGKLYELQILAPHTEEHDGFVLPTPTASDPVKHNTGGLHRLIVKGERYSKGDHRRKRLPTPTVNEAHNNPFTPSQWERAGSLNVEAAKMQGYTKDTIGKGFRLNPPFVEEMMGFAIGWTDLEP